MAKITDAGGRPHSGLQPFPVVGIVTDNVDPDELGRIKVSFPTLNEDPVSHWIRQVSPNAGIQRGLYALPEKDDEVIVMFMQGNVDTGVIMGQFWNGVDKPPAEAKDGLPGPAKTQVSGAKVSTDTFTEGSTTLEGNDRRFWKSRSGHLMVFDDTAGKESVQIWDGKHQMAFVFDVAEGRILLTNNKGDIHIRTAKNLFIEAGENITWHAGKEISGESGMKTAHKAGTDYEVEATANVKEKAGTNWSAEASMNATMKASVGATVEGSVTATLKSSANTTVTGSAMTKVSGGMVMIN